MTEPARPLPYRIACLCDLRDAHGRVLLLRRMKEPNKGLCSPIGGKLDIERGESPAQCAQREIREEAGLEIPIERLHLAGLVSEREFGVGEGHGHWLMFIYRVLGAVEVAPRRIREGELAWFEPRQIDALPLPETDRQVIWPLIRSHDRESGDRGSRPGFFAVHIECGGGKLVWRVEQTDIQSEPGAA